MNIISIFVGYLPYSFHEPGSESRGMLFLPVPSVDGRCKGKGCVLEVGPESLGSESTGMSNDGWWGQSSKAALPIGDFLMEVLS